MKGKKGRLEVKKNNSEELMQLLWEVRCDMEAYYLAKEVGRGPDW